MNPLCYLGVNEHLRIWRYKTLTPSLDESGSSSPRFVTRDGSAMPGPVSVKMCTTGPKMVFGLIST